MKENEEVSAADATGSLNGGARPTPEDAGLVSVVRLDVPLSDLSDEVCNEYFQAVGAQVQAMMPPGPDGSGRALFFLVMPNADAAGRPYPYVTNCDRPTLSPVLRLLASRFGSTDPDAPSSPERVVAALRRLSDAVEAAEPFEPGGVPKEGRPPSSDPVVDARLAMLAEYDAARSAAIEVLDALAPEPALPSQPKEPTHAGESERDDNRDRGDPEPARTRPDAPGGV